MVLEWLSMMAGGVCYPLLITDLVNAGHNAACHTTVGYTIQVQARLVCARKSKQLCTIVCLGGQHQHQHQSGLRITSRARAGLTGMAVKHCRRNFVRLINRST